MPKESVAGHIRSMPPKVDLPKKARHEPDVHTFLHHWQDEADAAFLYRILAGAEPDAKKKGIYARLAEVEDRHVVIWADLLSGQGHPPGVFRLSGRARILAWLGRVFGPGFLLPMLLQEEGREVKADAFAHEPRF